MRVKKVEYLSGYKIKLLFNDNKIKVVDLETELWGHMYEPLKDIEYFKLVSVDKDDITIVWPNGIDFSPDFLYEFGEDYVEKKPPVKQTSKLTRKKSTVIKHRATISQNGQEWDACSLNSDNQPNRSEE